MLCLCLVASICLCLPAYASGLPSPAYIAPPSYIMLCVVYICLITCVLLVQEMNQELLIMTLRLAGQIEELPSQLHTLVGPTYQYGDHDTGNCIYQHGGRTTIIKNDAGATHQNNYYY